MAFAAIQVKGEKELRKGLKQTEGAIQDLKQAHKAIGKLVLDSARPTFPSKGSGKLVGSWKSSLVSRGVRVYSSLVYAGVNEFGGRIPNRGSKGAGARMAGQKHARGEVGTHLHKPAIGGPMGTSYFIYPAIDREKKHIIRQYEEDIHRIGRKYGIDVDI